MQLPRSRAHRQTLSPGVAKVSKDLRAVKCEARPCLAGHAGSRIGWALVGDKAVADLMRDYLQLHGGVPAESQARAANDLEFVLSTRGGGWGAGTHSAAHVCSC